MQTSSQPYVEFLVLAEHVEVLNHKLYMMGGGWDSIHIHDFRQPIVLQLALSIMVPWFATNQLHTWTLSIMTSDGEHVTEIDGKLNVGRPPMLEHGATQRTIFARHVATSLPNSGTYVVVASIDGVESARVTFRALAVASVAPDA